MDVKSLPPNQYKAALYLLSLASGTHINVGKTDLAEALGISTAQANRLLSGLVKSGLIERIRRGRYRIAESVDDSSRIKNDSSGIKNDSSRITEAVESTIRIDDIVGLPHIRTDIDVTRDTALTSKEVSTGTSCQEKPKKRGKPVRYFDDDDIDLQAVGTAPSRDKMTSRQKRRYRAQVDFIGKPRDGWDTYDAAQFFAASIETRKPELFGRVNAGQFIKVLEVWMDNHRATLDLIVEAMDAFFASDYEMSRLVRGSRPMNHFLAFLKTYTPASQSVADWGSTEETARIFDSSILDQA